MQGKVLDEIKEGKVDYQFVEIMACPGGCVMGGGQPIVRVLKQEVNVDVRALRANVFIHI
jgi:NADP-reducing hydrogenase subunit HndD